MDKKSMPREKRFVEVRDYLGLNNKDVARMMNKGESTVRGWASNRFPTGESSTKGIADALEVDRRIFTDKNIKTKKDIIDILEGNITELSYEDQIMAYRNRFIYKENIEKLSSAFVDWRPDHYSKNTLLDLLYNNDQLFLFGKPGSGKTAALLNFCFNELKKYRKGDVVTIYVPLFYFEYQDRDLIHTISYCSKIQVETIKKLMDINRIRLLLDGYNECPSNSKTRLKNECYQLLQKKRTKIILTSRSQEDFDDQIIERCELKEIGDDHQKELIKKYIDEQNVNEIYEKRPDSREWSKIFRKPIYYSMLGRIFKDTDDIPSLYSDFIQKYIESYGLTTHKNDENSIFQICELAANVRAVGYNVLTGKFAYEVPSSLINKYINEQILDNQRLIDTLSEAAICKIERDRGFFPHKIIMWFLAAEYIAENIDFLKSIDEDYKAEAFNPVIDLFLEKNKEPDYHELECIWRIDPLLALFKCKDRDTQEKLFSLEEKPFFFSELKYVLCMEDSDNPPELTPSSWIKLSRCSMEKLENSYVEEMLKNKFPSVSEWERRARIHKRYEERIKSYLERMAIFIWKLGRSGKLSKEDVFPVEDFLKLGNDLFGVFPYYIDLD